MAMTTRATRCTFLGGGPLDGERRRVPDNWSFFRVPTTIRTWIDIGVETTGENQFRHHVYVRHEDEPDVFIYGGLD